MKKLLISIGVIVLIILLSWILKDIAITDSIGSYDRFIEVHDEGRFEVHCDRYTGVMYMRTKDEGLTVMLDKDGKPLLYEGE